MNGKRKAMRRSLWVMCAATAGTGWLLCPDTASAGHFDLRVEKGGSSVWVPPVYDTRQRLVTVPAICKSRPRQVWHEPVYDLRRVLVDIPAKVVTERVARRGRYGRIIGYRLVSRVIEPARQVWRTKRVLVKPGYYGTVYDRVCTRPETTRVVYDKVLVRKGRWVRPAVRKVHHRPRLHRLAAPHRGHEPRDDRLRVAFGIGW